MIATKKCLQGNFNGVGFLVKEDEVSLKDQRNVIAM